MFQDADLVADMVDITFSAMNKNDVTPSGPDAKPDVKQDAKPVRAKRLLLQRDENFWRPRLIERYMARGLRDH